MNSCWRGAESIFIPLCRSTGPHCALSPTLQYQAQCASALISHAFCMTFQRSALPIEQEKLGFSFSFDVVCAFLSIIIHPGLSFSFNILCVCAYSGYIHNSGSDRSRRVLHTVTMRLIRPLPSMGSLTRDGTVQVVR